MEKMLFTRGARTSGIYTVAVLTQKRKLVQLQMFSHVRPVATIRRPVELDPTAGRR